MMNFWNFKGFKWCVSMTSGDLHFKPICQYQLKWRAGLKANHRIRLSVNFHFSQMVGNYSWALLSSFSQSVFAHSVWASTYAQDRKRRRESARESVLYIISVTLATSENISQAVQGKCKSKFAESNARTHTYPCKGEEKKASSPHSPLYTHNALKWKTAHTGPGIEGGPNICFSLPCSVLIANDQIYNNL